MSRLSVVGWVKLTWNSNSSRNGVGDTLMGVQAHGSIAHPSPCQPQPSLDEGPRPSTSMAATLLRTCGAQRSRPCIRPLRTKPAHVNGGRLLLTPVAHHFIPPSPSSSLIPPTNYWYPQTSWSI